MSSSLRRSLVHRMIMVFTSPFRIGCVERYVGTDFYIKRIETQSKEKGLVEMDFRFHGNDVL